MFVVERVEVRLRTSCSTASAHHAVQKARFPSNLQGLVLRYVICLRSGGESLPWYCRRFVSNFSQRLPRCGECFVSVFSTILAQFTQATGIIYTNSSETTYESPKTEWYTVSFWIPLSQEDDYHEEIREGRQNWGASGTWEPLVICLQVIVISHSAAKTWSCHRAWLSCTVEHELVININVECYIWWQGCSFPFQTESYLFWHQVEVLNLAGTLWNFQRGKASNT